MREAQFNSEIVRALKYWGAWAYKIADLPVSLTRALRFSPTKPCDIIATYYGRFIAIESKQSKKWEAFGLSRMRPSQIKELDAIIEAESDAYVFLNVRITKGRVNKLFIFEWSALKRRLEHGSIKAKELQEMKSVSTFRGGEKRKRVTVFDLRPFLHRQIVSGHLDMDNEFWEPGDEE